jgi:hypothetical protein
MKTEVKAHALAAAYRRIFLSDDGKAVLADLTAKFDPERPRFSRGKQVCPITAAIIDGEGNVILEIRRAVEAGRYSADSTPNTPCQP